ncbi:epididymal sperm-binding protein 1-like isoform X2 [Oculina patagonica]
MIGKQDGCVFPFKYGGKTYTTCTYADHFRPWCAWDSKYNILRWSACECSPTEARRFNCPTNKVCIPAAEGKAAGCVSIAIL